MERFRQAHSKRILILSSKILRKLDDECLALQEEIWSVPSHIQKGLYLFFKQENWIFKRTFTFSIKPQENSGDPPEIEKEANPPRIKKGSTFYQANEDSKKDLMVFKQKRIQLNPPENHKDFIYFPIFPPHQALPQPAPHQPVWSHQRAGWIISLVAAQQLLQTSSKPWLTPFWYWNTMD